MTGDMRPEMFGAKGDQSQDDAPAIQACVNAHMALNSGTLGKGSKIVLSGRYRIDSPIECFRLNGSQHDFVTVNIEGDKPGYHGAFGPGLYPTFKDRPAIALQANRSSRFANFTIKGPTSLDPGSVAGLMTDDDPENSPWWNPAMDLTDSAQSPHCGFAVDPFNVTMSAEGGYPGWEANYVGNRGSSNVVWENMDVCDFIVGYAWSLSQGTQLGDSLQIKGGRISNCKIGVAVGQDQNRHCTIEGAHSIRTRIFCDGIQYGRKIGVPPMIKDCLIDYCRYVLNFDGSRGPGCLINCFIESTWSLGYWGGGDFPLDIINPWFKAPSAREANCCDTDYHLFAGAPVNVFGGFLGHYANQPEALSLAGGEIAFYSASLGGHVLPTYSNGFAALNYTGNCVRRHIGRIFNNRRSLMSGIGPGNKRNSLSGDGGFIEQTGSSAGEIRWRGRGEVKLLLESPAVTVTVGANGTATFNAAQEGRYYVGQFLSASQTSRTIKRPNGSTFSIQGAKFGRVASIVDGVVTLNEVGESVVSGNYVLTEPRIPTFRQRSIATTTSGSPTLTAVQNVTVWGVGDHIRGAGIPNGARILAIDTGAATITMSMNATANGSLVSIYDDFLQVEGETIAAPTTGTWWKGDYLRNIAPTIDANNMVVLGWLCVASGTPGTWNAVYGSTASPAA